MDRHLDINKRKYIIGKHPLSASKGKGNNVENKLYSKQPLSMVLNSVVPTHVGLLKHQVNKFERILGLKPQTQQDITTLFPVHIFACV